VVAIFGFTGAGFLVSSCRRRAEHQDFRRRIEANACLIASASTGSGARAVSGDFVIHVVDLERLAADIRRVIPEKLGRGLM